jgi:hypothetical protein
MKHEFYKLNLLFVHDLIRISIVGHLIYSNFEHINNQLTIMFWYPLRGAHSPLCALQSTARELSATALGTHPCTRGTDARMSARDQRTQRKTRMILYNMCWWNIIDETSIHSSFNYRHTSQQFTQCADWLTICPRVDRTTVGRWAVDAGLCCVLLYRFSIPSTTKYYSVKRLRVLEFGILKRFYEMIFGWWWYRRKILKYATESGV